MARPQFGTTRLHLSAIFVQSGEEATRRWLDALRAADVRLYDGNSAVVRAISVGEIDVGLTDTDDVYAGRRNNWPVDMVVEEPAPDQEGAIAARGAITIPNTAGLISGGPSGSGAAELIEFLGSAEMETLLTSSEARYRPLRGDVTARGDLGPAWTAAPLDYAAVSATVPAMLKLVG